MKNKFSTKWKSSKQPRRQRKYKANAPLHLRKKFVRANLSKELREKQGKRNMQLKKNDVVKIKRGKFKGREGKVLEIKLKTLGIVVEGMQVKKQDGSKANVKLQASNLQIIELSERANIKKTDVETKKEPKKETKKEEKKPELKPKEKSKEKSEDKK